MPVIGMWTFFSTRSPDTGTLKCLKEHVAIEFSKNVNVLRCYLKSKSYSHMFLFLHRNHFGVQQVKSISYVETHILW